MATAEIGSLNISLTLDSSSFAGALVAAQRSLSTFARDVAAQFQSLNTEINKLSAKLTVGLTVPFGLISRGAINAASDVEEMQSAFAFTFGRMSADVEKWAVATGDAIGRSTYELQQGALAFQQMFRVAAPTQQAAADMSKQFALLAQDLSSFYNVTPDVALMKLRSALQGESEPIRDFGVFLTEAAVAEEAVRMGIAATTKEVSEQAKILARANIIIRDTVSAQGDATRTAGSYQNQLRALSSQWQELTVAIGKILLPLATKIVTAMTSVVRWFSELPPWVHKAAIGIAAFAAALGPLLFIMKSLVVFLTARWVASTFGLLGEVVAYLLTPIHQLAIWIGRLAVYFGATGPVVQAVGMLMLRLAGWVGLVVSAFLMFRDYVLPVLQRLWTQIEETFGPRVEALIQRFGDIFNQIASGPFGDAIEKMIGLLMGLFDVVGTLAAFITDHFGKHLVIAIDVVLTTFEAMADTIARVVDTVNAVLSGDWARAWKSAGAVVDSTVGGWINIIGAIVPGIKAELKAAYEAARQWLVDGFRDIGDWLSSTLDDVVGKFGSTFPSIVATIRDFYVAAKHWLVTAFGPVIAWISAAVDLIAAKWRSLKETLGIGEGAKAGSTAGAAGGAMVGASSGAADPVRPAPLGKDDKKKKGRGASGPTAEDRARNAADEQRRLDQDIIRAKLDLETDARERANLEQTLLQMERDAYAEDLRRSVEDKQLSKAKADELLKTYDAELKWRQAAMINRELDATLDEQDLAAKRQSLEGQIDALRIQSDLARTTGERRAMELKLLDLQYDLERAQLQSVIDNEKIADVDRERARRAMADLNARQGADRERVKRANAGPLQSYLDTIPRGLAGINEQLESMYVNQLRRVEDGFANIATKVLGVKGALGEVLTELLRIVAQQAILAASGQGGGFFSGISAGIGAIFGGGGGGGVSTAGANWAVSGWANGGGGTIRGLPGVDMNTLSINGKHVARVSSGEVLSVSPKDMMSKPSINMPVNLYAPGADAAALGRIQERLDQFQREVPAIAVASVEEARKRRVVGR